MIINFQSRDEIPISQNLISFFFFFRSSRHSGAREIIESTVRRTNFVCSNNFRLILFLLFPFFRFSFFCVFFSIFFFFSPFFFFSSNRDAEKINNWQLFHWVHLILTADRLRSKPHYETKIMYKITMFLSRGYSVVTIFFVIAVISCNINPQGSLV